MADAGLDAEEETLLDDNSRQSLAAARVVKARQSNLPKLQGAGPWLGFGMELADADRAAPLAFEPPRRVEKSGEEWSVRQTPTSAGMRIADVK